MAEHEEAEEDEEEEDDAVEGVGANDEEVVNNIAHAEERKQALATAATSRKVSKKKKKVAEKPEDLKACCYVFFRTPKDEEEKGYWYCIASDYQDCSGRVKKQDGQIAKTGNFVDHCLNNHKDWYDQVERAFKEKGHAAAQKQFETLLKSNQPLFQKQKPMLAFVNRVKKAAGRTEKELRLLLWAIKCNVPLFRFDDPLWKAFLSSLDVTLAGADQLSRLIAPLFYIAEKMLTGEISKAAAVAQTADLWTSIAGDHYLGVTYHWMDDNFDLHAALLDVINVEGQAFGETIASVLDNRWQVHFPDETTAPRRSAFVSDRGSNIKYARDSLVPHDSENCFCHLVNSTVRSVSETEGLFFSRVFHSDLHVIESLSRRLRSQPHLMAAFQAKCPPAVAHLHLVVEQDTRWEGLVRECERALLLKEGFSSFFSPEDLADLDWSPKDVFQDTYWLRCRNYSHLLGAFRRVIRIAESESEPTLCQVVKLVVGLHEECRPCLEDSPSWKAVKKQFQLAVEHFLMPEIQVLGNVTKAALLDPRNHSIRDWIGEDIYIEGWLELKNEALELLDSAGGSLKALVTAQVDLLKEAMEGAWQNGSAEQPVNFFHKLKDIDRVQPLISMYLSIPASAAKPERVWSYTGWIVSKARNGLATDTVEAMAIIWDLIRKPGFNFDKILAGVEVLVKETKQNQKAAKEGL
jgi:hypothetical protein